jgi:hypothetical protein
MSMKEDPTPDSPPTVDGIAATIKEAHAKRIDQLKAQAVEQVIRNNPEPVFNEKVAEWAIANRVKILAAMKSEGHHTGDTITPSRLYWSAHRIIENLGKEHSVTLGYKDANLKIRNRQRADISQYPPMYLGLVNARVDRKDSDREPIMYICTPTAEAKALYKECFGDKDKDAPGTSMVHIVGHLL